MADHRRRHTKPAAARAAAAGPATAGLAKAGPAKAGLAKAGPAKAGLAKAGHTTAGLVKAGHTTAGLLLAGLVLAGCGDLGQREDAAAGVAVRLLTTVQAGDGAGACELLAPDTEESVAEDEPCERAILDAGLPRPGTVVGTDVHGQWAQVRLDDDTVFLAAFPGGWRVVAAGCVPRGDRPYDCAVDGN